MTGRGKEGGKYLYGQGVYLYNRTDLDLGTEVLAAGKVEAAGDANSRFLTYCIDPLCDQLQEECNRKRYGFEEWKKGNYMQIDSSRIIHFDLFANAANVEKLVGSGLFTLNDILEAIGRTPINEPWANKHFMTKNMAALTEVLKPAES